MSETAADVQKLVDRSNELTAELAEIEALPPANNEPRVLASQTLCRLAVEHADSVRVLVAVGNFTSAFAILRMQYEALTKAFWALYAASDNMIGRLQSELTPETQNRADKIPLIGALLTELGGKAPPQVVSQLNEFKVYSWKPLSSYIHGGIHAIARNSRGYPAGLLDQSLRASNGLYM
ncbi:MAG: hypothetical protein KA271_05365, partial [Propionivibrio sp.]|nr:hypothetical protein [Propionivibrio sp.]